MMVKHISIEVTSKQTKKPVFGGPADLTAYILEPVYGIRRLGKAAQPASFYPEYHPPVPKYKQ